MNDNNIDESEYFEEDIIDKYDEEWALKSNNYDQYSACDDDDLLERRNRIDEIYSIYEEMVLLDPNIISPDNMETILFSGIILSFSI